MKSVAVVALALLESAQAFQAGAAPMRTVSRAASPAMFKTGDTGVTAPLGVFDPLGLISTKDMKFADMPVGCFASLEATPTLGWLQIMAVTCAAEIGYASTPAGVTKQADDRAPGDTGGPGWKRYDDPEEKAFKL